MSDVPRPNVLTVLAILAVIIGIYAFLQAGLLIFSSIRHLSLGFDIVFVLFMGLFSAAVGVIALVSGIKVILNKAGCIEMMKKYAIALAGYQLIWIIFAVVSGKIVGWGTVFLDMIVAVGTFTFIITNGEVKKYSASCSNRTGS